MKKQINKKLALNKETISKLTEGEMNFIHGATILAYCSDSCSVFGICCDTVKQCDTKPDLNMILLTVVISNIC